VDDDTVAYLRRKHGPAIYDVKELRIDIDLEENKKSVKQQNLKRRLQRFIAPCHSSRFIGNASFSLNTFIPQITRVETKFQYAFDDRMSVRRNIDTSKAKLIEEKIMNESQRAGVTLSRKSSTSGDSFRSSTKPVESTSRWSEEKGSSCVDELILEYQSKFPSVQKLMSNWCGNVFELNRFMADLMTSNLQLLERI